MRKEKEVSVETAPELLPTTANTSDLVEVTSEGTPPAFEVVKAVTRPVLKFGISPEYIRIESPMRTGEKIEGAKFKELPTLLDVINLKTGEAQIIVCASVFRQELSKAYPDHGYVGKDFQVRMIKTPEKDYKLWGITEIRVK